MSTPYFTLAVRDSGTWSPQFGDYDRDVVAQESTDAYSNYKRADRKIIRTGDSHVEIDRAIAELNS
jgi:hypothetical protein